MATDKIKFVTGSILFNGTQIVFNDECCCGAPCCRCKNCCFSTDSTVTVHWPFTIQHPGCPCSGVQEQYEQFEDHELAFVGCISGEAVWEGIVINDFECNGSTYRWILRAGMNCITGRWSGVLFAQLWSEVYQAWVEADHSLWTIDDSGQVADCCGTYSSLLLGAFGCILAVEYPDDPVDFNVTVAGNTCCLDGETCRTGTPSCSGGCT